jgi:phosphoribosylaminoimidazole-succinocarboxamide synthase
MPSRCGLILADTKFEFGKTAEGIILADEVLTPDSSRFWEGAAWKPGGAQPSFDKQFVRDYLEVDPLEQAGARARLAGRSGGAHAGQVS